VRWLALLPDTQKRSIGSRRDMMGNAGLMSTLTTMSKVLSKEEFGLQEMQ